MTESPYPSDEEILSAIKARLAELAAAAAA